MLSFCLISPLQHLSNLFYLFLVFDGQLWEWASALPGCISPPGGVAGIAREWGGQRPGHRAGPLPSDPLYPSRALKRLLTFWLSSDPRPPPSHPLCPAPAMPFGLKLRRTRRYNVLSKNSFVTRIHLLDTNRMECTLSVESTGQECLEIVAQRLELREVSSLLCDTNFMLVWCHFDPM